ncbi:unnamed protein product [Clavelina lepadiformis]|uniref:DNA-directed RNA polymerase III subunit RPC3 n=1 Tax=Clavelina lepadiformis TaxID=159417 RepID=A0ABP0GIF1_CLALP
MLVMQEIPRTPDHAPSRTFYLFSVNVQKIAKILLIRSYKAITNMIIRRKCEEKSNTRLLEKQERITAIKETLLDADPDQLDEIDEMLTSSERARLAKHEHQSNKLHNAQLQITETVFILNAYVKSLQTFAISIK